MKVILSGTHFFENFTLIDAVFLSKKIEVNGSHCDNMQ